MCQINNGWLTEWYVQSLVLVILPELKENFCLSCFYLVSFQFEIDSQEHDKKYDKFLSELLCLVEEIKNECLQLSKPAGV